MIRLWHDDVRPAPDGWVWARTNSAAMEVLETQEVSHVSLDHDMGNHDLPVGTCDMGPGSGSGMPQKGEENGYHLVRWMIERGFIPPHIRVHAWNPSGGQRMYEDLLKAGANVLRQPYREGEKCEF